MLLLLIVASVPVIGIAGANAILGYEAERATGRRNAAMLREIAAERHGASVAGMREMLAGIAHSPALMEAPPERCASDLAMLLGIYRERYSNIWIMDGGGRLLCSALPTDSIGQSLAERNFFALSQAEATRLAANAADTGDGFVLDHFSTGIFINRPTLTGAVPLLRDGKLDRVVAAGLLMDVFIRSESQSRRDTLQRVWLVDRDAVPLPLTPARADELPDDALLRHLVSKREAGAVESLSRGGQDYAYAISALQQDLRLMVGLPTSDIRKSANAVLLRRAGELAAFLLACLIVIVAGADIAIARPLRALARRVREWRPGAPFGGKPLHGEPEEVRGLELAFTDAAIAIAAREEELRAALRQRDLLMAEIHHRVKNNLQIVASLLNLQARRLRDPAAKAEFGTARDRVQALATLHRHLYTNRTFEAIALRSFLEELCQQLFNALGEIPGRRIKLVVEADELEIVTDQAVSLALLVTEAVTNSIKHAFPGPHGGTITIAVQLADRPPAEDEEEGQDVILSIRDDGQGMAEDDEGNERGIGMTLIEGFAQHLGGEIERQPADGGGTELAVRFPLRRRESELAGRAMGPGSTT
jgi:two-component sensor histidine kinase